MSLYFTSCSFPIWGLCDSLIRSLQLSFGYTNEYIGDSTQLTYLRARQYSPYHKPLSKRYCQSRLKTIGKQVNINVTPHQLRHTGATLLLNAGMSIFALQSLLGHRHIETTLNYVRLYDETVVGQFLNARAPGCSWNPS